MHILVKDIDIEVIKVGGTQRVCLATYDNKWLHWATVMLVVALAAAWALICSLACSCLIV